VTPSLPTLDSIADDPASLSAAVRAALISRCAAVLAAVSADLLSPPSAEAPPAAHQDGPRLLDAQDVAERLGFAVAHVYELARSGRLPSVRVGKYVRFDLAAIQEWLHARAHNPLDRTISTVLSRGRETPRRPRAALVPPPAARQRRVGPARPDVLPRRPRRGGRHAGDAAAPAPGPSPATPALE
jgi:excisionase family DNA binding protein